MTVWQYLISLLFQELPKIDTTAMDKAITDLQTATTNIQDANTKLQALLPAERKTQ